MERADAKLPQEVAVLGVPRMTRTTCMTDGCADDPMRHLEPPPN